MTIHAEKFIKKVEKEKKKPKTVAYYLKILERFPVKIIKKFEKVLAIIDEEIKLDTSSSKCEPPYVLEIEMDKFQKAGLLASDAKKILGLLSYYLLIPKLPEENHKANLSKIEIYSPVNAFSFAIQDLAFKYPYEENLRNFKGAIEKAIASKATKKQKKKESISVKIAEMPELKIKGEARFQRTEDKKGFPHRLPAGTKWENIIIKFLDKENVLIKVNKFEHTTDYKEMGFEDKRGKGLRPNEQWVFLKVLAGQGGELIIKDPEAKDAYKKQKQFLLEALQSYFRIDYDPFFPYHSSPYKTGNSYKIKITLIPPPKTEDGWNDSDESDEKENDIMKGYKDLTPSVNDQR